MKYLIALFAVALFFACSKDNGTGPEPAPVPHDSIWYYYGHSQCGNGISVSADSLDTLFIPLQDSTKSPLGYVEYLDHDYGGPAPVCGTPAVPGKVYYDTCFNNPDSSRIEFCFSRPLPNEAYYRLPFLVDVK